MTRQNPEIDWNTGNTSLILCRLWHNVCSWWHYASVCTSVLNNALVWICTSHTAQEGGREIEHVLHPPEKRYFLFQFQPRFQDCKVFKFLYHKHQSSNKTKVMHQFPHEKLSIALHKEAQILGSQYTTSFLFNFVFAHWHQSEKPTCDCALKQVSMPKEHSWAKTSDTIYWTKASQIGDVLLWKTFRLCASVILVV